MRWFSVLLTLTLVVCGSSTVAEDPPTSPTEQQESEFVEQTRRTLVQLDVTVEGPADVIAELTPEDFELKLGGKKIREFTVDRFCGAPSESLEQDEEPAASPAPGVVPAPTRIRGVNYLFYFDQHHLTFRGRNRSVELAHDLIDELIQDGNKATIISSGMEMRTFAHLTDDRTVLHDAIDAVERDTKQVDTFPMQEDSRVENVMEEFASFLEAAALESSADHRLLTAGAGPGTGFEAGTLNPAKPGLTGPDQQMAESSIQDAYRGAVASARHVARDYQKEEWWRTDRALTRFSMALGTMANFDFPKAVVYFADTMRANAGEHYQRLLGDWDMQVAVQDQSVMTSAMPRRDPTPTGSVPAFDRVIEEAAAHGARLYTIMAEGLIVRAPLTRLVSVGMSSFGAASPGALDQRFDDAEDSLVGFALQTGGQAFLKGVSAERIAGEILGDMDCVYLVSFDPESFAEDRPLGVKVRVNRPDVEVRARGQMVIRSESARLTSRLMAAFAVPDEVRGGQQLVGVLVPTGFENGKYTALAQLIVPGSSQGRVDWDVGISVVSRNRLQEDASARITVHGQKVPVVFETVVRMEPGPWELTGVAHDSVSGEISAFRTTGDWPNPKDEQAMVGPIALLQPVQAAFMRDGATRREGSLARADKEPVRTDLPTALVGLVCRSRSQKGSLSIERRLIGETFVEFPDIDLAASRERCAVVTDVIPAGTMTAGMFQYELRVRSKEEDVASGIRELAALEPGE